MPEVKAARLNSVVGDDAEDPEEAEVLPPFIEGRIESWRLSAGPSSLVAVCDVSFVEDAEYA